LCLTFRRFNAVPPSGGSVGLPSYKVFVLSRRGEAGSLTAYTAGRLIKPIELVVVFIFPVALKALVIGVVTEEMA